MKTIQLQKAVLTDITKRHPVRWLAGRYEGRAALTDTYRIHLLRDEDLYINAARLAEFSDEAIASIMDENAGGRQDLIYISSHRGGGNAGAYDLYSCDDFEVAVNPAYLKYFEDFTLRGAGERAPVYVYELDELVGLVMPIRRGIR